jgi:outer membrane lipoprotein-sorting protein
LFRSVIAGFLVLVPLVAAVASIFGIMGITNIPLQMATATVSALAVGIGADYAIYFLYRLRDSYRESKEIAVAMRGAFASAGKAVMFVATAVAGGYAVLIASWGFYIHIWLGALIAMAMVVSAAAALTVMPALAVLMRPRFLFGERVAAPAPAGSIAAMLAALVLIAPTAASAQALTADQIMERNFVTMRVHDSVANVTFHLFNPSGQERVRQTISRTMLRDNGTDSMRQARFMSPSDIRGTVVLMIENLGGDDDMWIYLPAARRVRRLTAANRRDAFVGSDFTYGDIIGHRVSDWTHQLLREEAVGGRPTWVIESRARTPQVQSNTGYSRRVQWIDRENFVAMRGEAYDEAGQLLRRFSASDIRLVDQAARRYQPMTLEAQNVQSHYRTVIRFENFRANQGVSPEYFTTRAMERDE